MHLSWLILKFFKDTSHTYFCLELISWIDLYSIMAEMLNYNTDAFQQYATTFNDPA